MIVYWANLTELVEVVPKKCGRLVVSDSVACATVTSDASTYSAEASDSAVCTIVLAEEG